MTIPQKKGEPIVVAVDEHPRPGTTVETLAKLKGVNGAELRDRGQRLGRQRRRRRPGHRLRRPRARTG